MKGFFEFILVMSLMAGGGEALGSAAAAPARRPNIVFILADDLGYGDIGPFGQRVIRTPTLDRLAAEGMKLTQHYSGSPVCAPSRCVLLTGKHPGHAFIRDNREVGDWYSFKGQMPLPATEITIATALKSVGYVTGAFGKWGLGGVGSPGDPLKHGFDRFFGFNCQRQAHSYYPHYLITDEAEVPLGGNANVTQQEGVSLAPGADPNAPASYAGYQGTQYAPDLCCAEALKFVEQNKGRPFFLYYPTTVPHLPLQVPEDSLAEYKGRLPDEPYRGGKGYLPQQYPHAAYAAMITRMDRDIGRLVELVKELGLEEQTIFVFTSDNGAVYPLAGVDPEYFHSNGSLQGYKGSAYEGGIRVPLIVRWKGHIAANTSSAAICGFEDWFPTLLELAGASETLPAKLDGVSFAPTLLGRPQPARPALYREFHGSGGQASIRAGDWKLLQRNLLAKGGQRANPTVELFNLELDPREKTDVSEANHEIVTLLKGLMLRAHTPSTEFPVPSLDQHRIP